MGTKLDIGVAFPRLALKPVDGKTLVIPDDLASTYTVLLFYRGHW